MRSGFLPWRLIDRISDLIPTLGTSDFASQFFALYRDALEVDACTVFAFRDEYPPDPIMAAATSAEFLLRSADLTRLYVAGAYAEDSNLPRGKALSLPIVRAVRTVDLQESPYRTRFYDEPHLSHELVLIGYARNTLYSLSFYRHERTAVFAGAEVQIASRLAELTINMIHKHWAAARVQATIDDREANGPTLSLDGLMQQSTRQYLPERMTQGAREELNVHLRNVLISGPHGLSRREAEVCAGIVLGRTTLGIALTLGITPDTVATHRKHAYRKLGICSQNELFGRYFKIVNEHLNAVRIS